MGLELEEGRRGLSAGHSQRQKAGSEGWKSKNSKRKDQEGKKKARKRAWKAPGGTILTSLDG
jgi:hypothetical protein